VLESLPLALLLLLVVVEEWVMPLLASYAVTMRHSQLQQQHMICCWA
jgi:hypothetical protein